MQVKGCKFFKKITRQVTGDMPHKCYDDTYKNWNDNGCMNLNIERTSFNVPDCESTSGMNVSDSGMKVPPPAVCMSKTLVKFHIHNNYIFL